MLEPPEKKLRRSPRVNSCQKPTASVKLRVQAEYEDHLSALRKSSDFFRSTKDNPVLKKLEILCKAHEFIRTRDLGTIMCNETFSELSHLDSFWADYLNGSLREAIKDVFLNDRLKEAIGEEPIQILISVNEQDFRKARAFLKSQTSWCESDWWFIASPYKQNSSFFKADLMIGYWLFCLFHSLCWHSGWNLIPKSN